MPSSLPPEGSLATHELCAVLGAICTRGWTGALVLAHAGASRTLHWDAGRLVAVSSTHPDDRVADLMFRRGRLTLAQYAALPRAADDDALLAGGLVSADELPRLRGEAAEQAAARALDATEGVYRMVAAAPREGDELPRATAEVVAEAVLRIGSWARVQAALGGAAATYRRSERYEEFVAAFALSFERLSILMDLHGERPVAAICAESSLPDFEVCRLLLAFRVLGAIVRVDEPTHVDLPVDDDGLGDVLEEEDEAEEIATSAAPARRVLLVAVEPDLASRLEPMLGRAAFSVERTEDGATALAACLRGRFDLVMVADSVGVPSLAELLDALRRTGGAGHVVVAADAAQVASLRAALTPGSDLAIVARDPVQLLEEVASRLLGAAPRVAARLMVRLQVRVQASRQLVLLQTENVSATGMLLRTDQQFAVGTPVALEFQVPGDRHPIVGEGEVVRHTHPDVEKGRGIGVRYRELRGDGQKRLEDYLAGLAPAR